MIIKRAIDVTEKCFLVTIALFTVGAMAQEVILLIVSVFKWFETDGLISQRRDWLIGFKV